ncbi:hypothetical protein K6119_12020 [Paracrocinitomix mangrovi]|uniref:hypothetical protein n=1 Tax=Paracrocinitomix mangrovi TaxID=2862509 RepID=UPI001C8E10CF|nr:hypothetical protein [Paracrocinitomix mangrovi]UKN00458.1 hypothetical protein K6119_12020 [Paracrocinitomix mangrovi]
MKIAILTIGLALANISFAGLNPSLKKEITEKVQLDLSQFEFDTHHENFVVVSFSIENFQIEILEIQGTSEILINMMTLELNNLKIDRLYSQGNIYNYKFVFKKL